MDYTCHYLPGYTTLQTKKSISRPYTCEYGSDIVHYPGSSCGLDPTETGIRSFLVYDTVSTKVDRLANNTVGINLYLFHFLRK